MHEPDRLVNLVSPGPRSGSVSCGQAGSCDAVFSYPMFRDLERVQTSFTGIAAHRDFGANIAYGGVVRRRRRRARVRQLLSGAWPDAAARPLLGPDDDREQGGGHVVVLSEDYWRRRFGGRADVINQPLLVNGQALTIVGVAPRGFHGTTIGVRPLYFVPISMRDVVVPRWKGARQIAARTGSTCSRASSRASRASRRARPSTRIPSHHHRRRGAASERDERRRRSSSSATREMQLEPGARGQSRVPGEVAPAAHAAVQRDGDRAADLLRECRQPAARPRRAPLDGDGRSSFDRRRAQAHRRPAAHRVAAARRSVGGVGGLLVARWTLTAMSLLLPDGAAKRSASRSTREMLLVRGRLVARDRPAVRPVSCDSQHAAESRGGAESQCGSAVRRKSGGALPRHARDGADRAVDGAARRCGLVHEEPLEHHARRSRPEDGTSSSCSASRRRMNGYPPRAADEIFEAHRRRAARSSRE